MVLLQETSGAKPSSLFDYRSAIFSPDGSWIFDSILIESFLENTQQPLYETIPFDPFSICAENLRHIKPPAIGRQKVSARGIITQHDLFPKPNLVISNLGQNPAELRHNHWFVLELPNDAQQLIKFEQSLDCQPNLYSYLRKWPLLSHETDRHQLKKHIRTAEMAAKNLIVAQLQNGAAPTAKTTHG